MKVLVIGLSPSPLGGKSPSLKTIQTWMSSLGIEKWSFYNLYLTPDRSKCNVVEIIKMAKDYDRIICLGAEASKILYRYDVDHYLMPHPSPRNRMMNDKILIKNAIEGCSLYLRG
jgi:hypothetical protein